MLNSQDLKQIKTIVEEVIDSKNLVTKDELKALRSEIDKTLVTKNDLKIALKQVKGEIIEEISDFMSESLIPELDKKADLQVVEKHERDISNIKTHLAMAAK